MTLRRAKPRVEFNLLRHALFPSTDGIKDIFFAQRKTKACRKCVQEGCYFVWVGAFLTGLQKIAGIQVWSHVSLRTRLSGFFFEGE